MIKIKKLESADTITVSETTWRKVERYLAKYSGEKLYAQLSIYLGKKVTPNTTILISKNVEVIPCNRLTAEQQLEMWLINNTEYARKVAHRELLRKRKINNSSIVKTCGADNSKKIIYMTAWDRSSILRWLFKQNLTYKKLIKQLKEKYREMFKTKEQDKSLLVQMKKEAKLQNKDLKAANDKLTEVKETQEYLIKKLRTKKNWYKWAAIFFAWLTLLVSLVHFL